MYIRTRGSLAARKAAVTTVYTDENSDQITTRSLTSNAAAFQKSVPQTSAVLQPKNQSLAKENADSKINGVVTRKRATLGDVSNLSQPATRAVKPRGGSKPTVDLADPTAMETKAAAGIKRRRIAPVVSTRSRATSVDVEPRVSALAGTKRKQDNVVDERLDESYSDPGVILSRCNLDVVTLPSTEVITTSTSTTVAPRSKMAKVQAWDDLDAEDIDDPLMVAEYVNEIFDYMRKLELKSLPNPCYMDQQKELAWKMRGILVDWLVEVHTKFRLLGETLFLTVNLIDRFLSKRTVSLVKLQLVGITAMFVAAKYEEIMAPSVQNFIYMADGGYSDEEVLNAERYLLQVLGFDLSYPNPLNFLRRVSKADNYDFQTRTLAKYFMEISLVDYRFLACPPSLLAAAGTYLSRKMLDRGPWDANLDHYSGYTEVELQPCVQLMVDFIARPVKHESFFKKYASKKFMKASLFAREWVSRQHPALVLTYSQGGAVANLPMDPLQTSPTSVNVGEAIKSDVNDSAAIHHNHLYSQPQEDVMGIVL
ncbi:G2/mitotic-specific cyclin [Dispira simplex]|nr:G2/mitotic-specific cyclin [Dispira simplex]